MSGCCFHWGEDWKFNSPTMVSARENAELPVGEQSCGLVPDLCQLLPALSSGCILAGTFPEGDLVTCKRGMPQGLPARHTVKPTSVLAGLLIFRLILSKVSVYPGLGLLVSLGSE